MSAHRTLCDQEGVLGNKVEVNVEKLRKGGANDLCLLKYLNQEGTAHLPVPVVVEGFDFELTRPYV
jgi:hypothetical protein